MIGTYFIIIAVIIGLAFLGLGISTFFGKKKKFPDTHIGKNKAMKERGISCAATTDRLERANYKPIEILIVPNGYWNGRINECSISLGVNPDNGVGGVNVNSIC